MIIRIKGIWHERTEDAPFVGALVSSIDCNRNCKNCFNQHIKDYETIKKSDQEIVDEIKENPFNQGIILAGLEWTTQPTELVSLIGCSLDNGLKVMLYTGMEEHIFAYWYMLIYKLPIYMKFGSYNEACKNDNYFSCGVKLASNNQYIRWLGK